MNTKKLISALLALILICIISIPANANSPFSDVPSGKWYSEGVSWCASKGYVSGYKDGTFRPNEKISRAEMAVIMSKMLHLTENSPNTFTDVPNGKWYTDAVLKCIKAGIISGYGNGRFGPGDSVTREQAAVMFSNAFGIGLHLLNESYTDNNSISGWSLYSIGAMSYYGYMSGTGNNAFSPKTPLTRGQIVTIIRTRELDVEAHKGLGADGWQDAYIDFIRNGKDDRGQVWDEDCEWRLIDVDGNGIPELQRVVPSHLRGLGHSIVSYHNGQLMEFSCYRSVSTEEGTGKVLACVFRSVSNGIGYDWNYYTYRDGTYLPTVSGTSRNTESGRMYTWNGVSVSEEEFDQRTKAELDTSDDLNGYLSKAEIIHQINMYR